MAALLEGRKHYSSEAGRGLARAGRGPSLRSDPFLPLPPAAVPCSRKKLWRRSTNDGMLSDAASVIVGLGLDNKGFQVV
jgi:hypothetical protein